MLHSATQPFARALAAALLALLALLAGVRPAAAQPAARPPARPMVVLVSIDGLQPAYVLDADRLGLRIPTLRRMLREGAHARGVRGVVPTVTYPSHVTLLTGVSPARHGVVANNPFDPLGRNDGGWYWYAEDVRVPTLWEAAAGAGLTTAALHWPVSVGAKGVRWNVPQIWRKGTPDDDKLLRALSTPGLLDTLTRELGPFPGGIDESLEADETRARFAARVLERHRPDFATFYFTALDHEQHIGGPFSAGARATLERLDAVLGRLHDAASRASGGRVVFAVVSDHGFAATDRDVHLNAALHAAGLLTLADTTATARVIDWRAWAWPSGGTFAVVLRDPADAALRGRVRALLDSLARRPDAHVARVLDAPALAEWGGYPSAAFLVEVWPGARTGGRVRGPLVTRGAAGGTHGFLPDRPELQAALFVTGPGVAAGRDLGLVDMRDVAPTLARALGVRLETAEGRVLQLGSGWR